MKADLSPQLDSSLFTLSKDQANKIKQTLQQQAQGN